jgi:sialate O-acetylesterase
VGGTPSGLWLSEQAYRSDAACQEVAKKFAATYDLEAAKRKYERDLAEWKKAAAVAKAEGKRLPRGPEVPVPAGECNRGKIGTLYEAFIRPFVGYGIRGVLWDQGESGTAIVGVDQYTLMGALIRGWRREWGQGDFPFLYVQKPSGGGCAWDPNDPVTKQASQFGRLPQQVPADGSYRETHIRIMRYPSTAMVSSTDLGSGVHPVSKSAYGERACRVALGFAYGRKVEFYGPLYESHTIQGGKIRVRFTHVRQGLAFRPGDKLQGFAVAGEDKKFHWADAVIDGDSVVVSSANVPKPVAVRYAWSPQHPWANLFNKDGLPAQAFRTDRW